ncbi:MAG TPA: Hsp70 family protein [Acidimicrobiales bacterium]|nr:Hsp70 family protein [Acidimicrobiales bacterium]
MGYQLGVDLGTTHTMAAVLRQGQAEIVPLGSHSGALRSIVFIDEDDTVVVGDAADHRGLTDPSRVARAFKRRLGDPTPVVLGGRPHSAEGLMAALLSRVVDLVAEREGGPPTMVTVSHPANWGAYRMDLLGEIVDLAGLEQVRTLSDPEAAAVFHDSTDEVAVGDVVAVYDLGGGTFDVAVARKVAGGFEMLGLREGVDRLGGLDFDEAVLAHISGAVGVGSDGFESDDPQTAADVARLRSECAVLKETLSTETEVSVPVFAPGKETEVRITRDDLEELIRPALAQTVGALRRSLRSASVEPADLAAVLLAGGSARIPLVARMVSEELGRPVEVVARPKDAVALGAALSMRSWAEEHDRPTERSRPAASVSQGATPEPDVVVATTSAPAPAAPVALAGAGAATALLAAAGPATPDAPTTAVAGAAATTTGSPEVTETVGTRAPSASSSGATATAAEVVSKSPAVRPEPPSEPPGPSLSALRVIAAVALALAMIGSAVGAGVLIATGQVAVGAGAVVVGVAAGVGLFVVMRPPAE